MCACMFSKLFMINQIILIIIFCGFSNIFALYIGQFKALPGSELERIKLRSNLNKRLIEDAEAELERLEKVNKYVKMFDEINELKELIIETLKWIEEEKMEIETFKEFSEEIKSKSKESIDEYVKSLESAVEGIFRKGGSKPGVISKEDTGGTPKLAVLPFDQYQVLIVKKWLLSCKFLKNNICNCKDFEELTNDQTSAIKILQKDENGQLLRNLSEKVKVQVWPVNLNISGIISKYRNLNKKKRKGKGNFHDLIAENNLIERAQSEIKNVLKNIKTLAGSKDLEEEINFRIQFIDEFMKRPKNNFDLMTISLLCWKKDAFIKLIDTFMKKLELKFFEFGVNSVNESDLLIVKKWLFFNQMVFAVDWVTRSGKFVKTWPEGSIIGDSYEIPGIEDTAGYFTGLPKMIAKKEEEAKEKKSVASRITSFFGFEKEPTPPQIQTKSLMSRALDRGSTLVKGSATKLYNSFKPKNAREEADVKSEGDAGAGAGGKIDSTTGADDKTVNKVEESKGILSRLFSSKKGSSREGDVMTKSKSKGFFRSLIPASW